MFFFLVIALKCIGVNMKTHPTAPLFSSERSCVLGTLACLIVEFLFTCFVVGAVCVCA